MKIGILTYHCVPNFGAQLQALSTVGYLKSKGHEPIILNWYPQDLEEFYMKRAPESQNRLQKDFAQKNMPLSKLCKTMSELVDEIKRQDIECIILGSDALFDYTPEKYRYNYSLKKLKRVPISFTSNHLLPNPFWGSFNDILDKQIPIYGYAISSQNIPFKDLSSKEKKEIHRLLNGFEVLTVRDDWTKRFVETIGNRSDVTVAPDPVFAFNSNYSYIPSKQQILEKYKLPEEYILVSFVYDILTDDFVNNIIKKIETDTSASCVSFPMPDRLRKFSAKYTINLPLDPIDWYALIKYSQGYIGERMHPIITCLHNSVPFFCFDQYGANRIIIPRIWSKFSPESSKVYDILKRANFEKNSCFYSDAQNITPEYVVKRFLSFDKKACANFSRDQLKRYNEAMSKLLFSMCNESSDS